MITFFIGSAGHIQRQLIVALNSQVFVWLQRCKYEHEQIAHYEIEHDGGQSVDGIKYGTQKEAHESAKRQHHYPILCARVRATEKGRPDHWRSCE